MTEFLAMHGYGMYVWPAYALFIIALIADALAPVFARRRILRELGNRLRRTASRKTT